MRPSSSVSDFLANPIGRFFRGRRHAVFAYSPTLIGLVAWGRPDVDDVRELLQLCEIGLQPGVVPHRFLADLRGLDLIEPSTFGMFVDYTRKNRETLKQNIIRQAQLRPDGLVGAIISGFSFIAKLPYPEKVFGDVEEALGWLEVDAEEGVELLGELDAIRNDACESYEIVTRLRVEFDRSPTLAVEEAARRLGLSTRTFQRALRQAGTTYRVELRAFRIRRAQEFLRDSERNLKWIAAELGYSSAQHFAIAYRRDIGETPAAWRKRQQESA